MAEAPRKRAKSASRKKSSKPVKGASARPSGSQAPKASAKTTAKQTSKKAAKKAAKKATRRKSSKQAAAALRPERANGHGTSAPAARPLPQTDEVSSEAVGDLIPRSRRRPSSAGCSAAGESGKYVYCIIPSQGTGSFGRIGIGATPTEVHTVGYEDIAAVVSDTPIEVYDPTRENVLAHEHVNETVMHDHTVIPMSFGTVFKTADDIVELLRSAYGAFRDVLQKMENKLEFGLKVLWDPDEIIREVEKEDENLRRLREEILKQRGSTYFARMQYGRLVDSLLQERSEYYVREIFETLRPVAVASRANKPIGDRMIMNGAFLVSRDLEADFDAQVKAIGGRLPQLTFKYTGPWPPYNFVNIRLKLERAKEPG